MLPPEKEKDAFLAVFNIITFLLYNFKAEL